MKKVLQFIGILILSYLVYLLVNNFFARPPSIGIITGEYKWQKYFIPKDVTFYKNFAEVAKFEFDPNGNQVKAQGEIPDGRIVIYYDITNKGKRVFMRGYTEENKLNGPAKVFNQNGQLWIDASYRAGKLQGLIKEYYVPPSRLKRVANYSVGLLEGNEKKYYSRGNIYTDANYKTNRLHGPLRIFYEKGNLQEESNYENGLKTGVSKQYYPSGKLYSIANYNKQGQLSGPYSLYTEAGQVKYSGVYQGEKAGKSGQKQVDYLGNLDLAKKDVSGFSGLYKIVAAQPGRPALTVPQARSEDILTAQRLGVPYSASRSGQRAVQSTASDQIQDYFGNVDVYAVKDEDKRTMTYAPGQPTAIPERVIKDTNGKTVDFSSLSDNNLPLGNGKLSRGITDRVIKDDDEGEGFGGSAKMAAAATDTVDRSGYRKARKFYPNGNIYIEAAYRDDVLDGKTRIYYENQVVKAEINFKNGKKDGPSRTYYPSGKLESETNFSDGYISSKKIFSETGEEIYSW